MHNTILQNALEVHIEPNMQYCTILFSGQQIFVESCHPSLPLVKVLGENPKTKMNMKDLLPKGEHRRGGLLLLRLCSKLNELLA